ncbi:hypothetical protein Tsubulata_045126 [Turnera subulata]|uniref:CCHC-type domain-containing protein n=1 Tax=Turnera subulata TaxID=218843 RepID=A0A9Q0G5K0_9ROSI|nr:hypothetical protein Tsubulata_045126 [Turnera subulata]
MTEGQPSDGGLRPPATAPIIGADTTVEPPRSFRDTLTQGSMWNEPTIDTNFAIEDGDVIVIASLQGPIVRYTDRFRAKLYKAWENTLIIKPWGRGGPWMILGQYLSVETWRPNFNPSTDKVISVVAWVRIPGLPVEHYHVGVLKMVCDMIGKTVRIDIPAQQTDRAQFARIAVKLDLTKPLEPRVCFEGIWYNIEYEDLPTICFDCGIAGHNMSSCLSQNQQTGSVDLSVPISGENAASMTEAPQHTTGLDIPREYSDVSSDPKYGKWMLVSRKPRLAPRKPIGNTEDKRPRKV